MSRMNTHGWMLSARLAFSGAARAQVYTETVYDLSGGNGSQVWGNLAARNGILYGTTAAGGNFFNGTVFSLTPPTEPGGSPTETVLYSFGGGMDGSSPMAGVTIGIDGTLYGTTLAGGSLNYGTVYSLTPPLSAGGVWTETVLHTFTGPDGTVPFGGVTVAYHDDGQVTLYGMTSSGGSGGCSGGPIGCGVVFSLTAPAFPGGVWDETVIHDFEGGANDGSQTLYGGLTLAGGVLYGTTAYGGSANFGTVFTLHPPRIGGCEWTLQILHSFAGGCHDGSAPFGTLAVGPRGALYGTTYEGGEWNAGTVYSLSQDGPAGTWVETILHAFSGGTDGATPYAGVTIGNRGVLYGTTATGGTGSNDRCSRSHLQRRPEELGPKRRCTSSPPTATDVWWHRECYWTAAAFCTAPRCIAATMREFATERGAARCTR